jgi:hypothetical protein
MASKTPALGKQRACGNHGQLYLQTGFWQEGEAWLRTRFPAESAETLAHGFFTKPKPAGNPTIAHLLGFETENGAVSFMKFLGPGRTGGRPSSRARECAQSTGFETLLITAKCLGRVAEATCDIVMIRVSRLEKLNHGVGFGRTILNRVMGEDDAIDEEHSLALLGLNANAIVYEDGTGNRGRDKKPLWRCRRAHVFLACSISTDSKSGQFKVRTQESKKLCRLHSRRDQQKKNIGTCSFGCRRIGNAEIYNSRLKKRTV